MGAFAVSDIIISMQSFNHLLDNIIIQIINPLIILISAGAFVVFLWGVFIFIKNASDDTKRAEAQSAILWGLIGLAIIFGVYGILNIALNTFGLTSVSSLTGG